MTPRGGLEPGYLAGRLLLVEERVRRAVAATRDADPNPDDPLRGLHLSPEGAYRLAERRPAAAPPRDDAAPDGTAPDSPPDSPVPDSPATADDLRAYAVTETLAAAEAVAEVEAWADRAEAAGADVRLRRLARDFGLDPLDVEILLIALLPDLDPRYEKLYGYLNDDLTRRRASIGLALWLCGAPMGSGAVRARFAGTAPLVSGGLLAVEDADRPFLTRSLRVPDRVAGHLLDDDTPDGRLAGMLRPDPNEAVAVVGADGTALGAALLAGARLVYLRERPGSAASELAATGLAAAGYRPLRLDLGALFAHPAAEPLLIAAGVEARLRGGGLVTGPVEALTEPVGDDGGERERGARLLRRLTGLESPVVLTGRGRWDPEWSDEAPLPVTVEPMGALERAALWRAATTVEVAVDLVRELAPYVLGPQQIRRAAAVASRQALLGGADRVGAEHIRTGVRSQNAAGLDRLARRVEPGVGWSDLVLPAEIREQLEEFAARVRHRDRVLGQWRLRPGGGRGWGVTALFAGDSGTGKTMSAEVVAADLGVDLYVVDLSTVVDKYIGQTEKNLERIFTEATSVNAVLLFDEADAIFGKRSEVADAHDRYANIESAYLLQRMESFDGVAILTTNLRSNLDEAFTRRLDVIVDFPMPDRTQRLALWDHCLGTRLPRAADLDLGFFANSFELSGGGIRACAVTAGYLAASNGGEVTRAHLMTAAQREYRKLGRLLVDSSTISHPPAGGGPR